jgi:hypothetical protein
MSGSKRARQKETLFFSFSEVPEQKDLQLILPPEQLL